MDLAGQASPTVVPHASPTGERDADVASVASSQLGLGAEAATLGKFGQAMERHSGGVLGGNSLVDQALSQKSLLAG
eukprot:8004349-Pyramimonas_sp.AAC.1